MLANTLTFDISRDRNNLDIIFGDRKVSFTMPYYRKTRDYDKESLDPYYEFNLWVKEQPIDWQERMFERYILIKDIIENEKDVDLMLADLNNVYIELYNEVSEHEVRKWILRPDTPINIPRNPKSDRYNSIANESKEKTYGYDDYLALTIYSFVLRFVVPAWGSIAKMIATQHGNPSKELYSMEVIAGTWLHDGEAESRLMRYITSNKEPIDMTGIVMTSLNESDFYIHIFSMIIVKKIALGEVNVNDGTYRLVANIYYHCDNKMKDASRTYGSDSNSINVKRDPYEDRNMSDDNNSRSILETGFSRTTLNEDEKVFLIECLNNHEELIEFIYPELDRELYKESMENLYYLRHPQGERSPYDKPLQPVQITLLKWLLHNVVNTEVLSFISLDQMIDLIGLARAIYWQMGYPEIAMILSGTTVSVESSNIRIGYNIRKNISSELQNELFKVYRYHGTNKSVVKSMNPISVIEILSDNIHEYNWVPTLPEKWLEECKDITIEDGIYLITPDLRSRLANLLITIANMQSMN